MIAMMDDLDYGDLDADDTNGDFVVVIVVVVVAVVGHATVVILVIVLVVMIVVHPTEVPSLATLSQ